MITGERLTAYGIMLAFLTTSDLSTPNANLLPGAVAKYERGSL